MSKTEAAHKELNYYLDYYPASGLRLEAYYLMSRVHVQKKDIPVAIAWLLKLLRKYPEGEHLSYVKLKILFLNELRNSSGTGSLSVLVKKYEDELKVRDELNDLLGQLLEKAAAE